jgi:hypothetical protein
LLPASEKTHDARKGGKMIQIKLTGGNDSVALSSKPDHLIVLQFQNLKFCLVYNGPGAVLARAFPPFSPPLVFLSPDRRKRDIGAAVSRGDRM